MTAINTRRIVDDDPLRWISRGEAAGILHISVYDVAREAREVGLQAIPHGGSPRYRLADVEALAALRHHGAGRWRRRGG